MSWLLWSEKKSELSVDLREEQTEYFDVFNSLADRDYSDVSANAAFHALLLETTMERHGFQGYQGEWWHFNDTDEYPIETEFDPASR